MYLNLNHFCKIFIKIISEKTNQNSNFFKYKYLQTTNFLK